MATRWSSGERPDASDYDARWEALAAAGADPHGEASFVASLQPGSVFDAGCGTGRVAIELARRGIEVVGVDLDSDFIEHARRKAPTIDWRHADLATVDLARTFDVVVAAGNVMIFLTPGTEGIVLENFARHLAPGGHVVTGFQLLPGRLKLAEFDRLAGRAGLTVIDRFSTWSADPYDGGDYAVSVLVATDTAVPGTH